MDINNIALVRATNIIPFDGIVHPISEVPYLHKERGTQFYFAMFDLLKNKGLLKEIDWSKPDEMNEIDKYNNEILKQYMPYTSGYNSMVLWALNGLVPDDTNNTFSNKTCAIIDGLAEQIEQSEVVSLVPTDTAIKGSVTLSGSAIILISKERYETLSQEEKEQLSNLDMTITIFEGDLKEAVDVALTKDGRYTAETLSLRRVDNGYLQSDTSDEVRATIHSIANNKEIAQVLHLNVITGQNDEKDKLKSVENEFEKGLTVTDFYKRNFFSYLFSKMDIDNRTKGDALYFPESPAYMEALCNAIDIIGLDTYKSILDNYNQSLEKLQSSGKLPTPEEIVTSAKEKKQIDLISMIEENSNENQILSSAIEQTEETTRTGVIVQQTKELKQIVNEKSKEPDQQTQS